MTHDVIEVAKLAAEAQVARIHVGARLRAAQVCPEARERLLSAQDRLTHVNARPRTCEDAECIQVDEGVVERLRAYDVHARGLFGALSFESCLLCLSLRL